MPLPNTKFGQDVFTVALRSDQDLVLFAKQELP